MPVSKTDYPKFLLTSGAKPVYSVRIQNFHLAVSHLQCFDASLTKGSGEVKFNWLDTWLHIRHMIRMIHMVRMTCWVTQDTCVTHDTHDTHDMHDIPVYA